MTLQTTYTHARAHFAELCKRVTDEQDIYVIQRRGARDVALIAADELDSLLETAHLLRSPKNAERLLTALARAQTNKLSTQSVAELRNEVGVDVA